MIITGADIIDVGGESTRPGSKIISQKSELQRVEKVIKEFKKKSKHTSKLTLYKSNLLRHMDDTKMEIYIYRDAKMAEVRKFNGKRQFWLRNKYPNKNMLTKDEKFQWNIFLSEFLSHSISHGLSVQEKMH